MTTRTRGSRRGSSVPAARRRDRLYARLYDGLCIYLVALLLAGVHLALRSMFHPGAWDWLWRHPEQGQAVVWIIYEATFLSLHSASPGKRRAGLVVADSRTGGRVGVWQAVARTALLFGGGLLPYVGGLLAIVVLAPMLWDGIGLHDRLTGTVVTYAGEPEPSA